MILNYLINSNPYFFEDYPDAPNLDPELPWYEDIDEGSTATLDIAQSEQASPYNIIPGDLIWADVYQDNLAYINLKHKTRPFVVTSVAYDKVYGFQLSHEPADSLIDGAVPVEDFSACGLNGFGYILTNMERGVAYQYLYEKIGHITAETRDKLLDKLKEIKANKDGRFSDRSIYKIHSRIDTVIEKLYRVIA